MLEPVFQFFEKLVSDFSWRRLTLTVTILGLIFGVAYVYESQTGYFELQKTSKEIALLSDLIDLSEKASNAPDPDIQQSIESLKYRLRIGTSGAEDPGTISVTTKKVLAAALAWIIFGVLILLASATDRSTSNPFSTIIGIAIAGTPFIVLAAFLPTFDATWINYYLYPVGHMAIVVALIMLWHRNKQKRNAN